VSFDVLFYFVTYFEGKKLITSTFLHIVKLMIVDDHIGIQGNGNQDTQSWFHSQETNIMIDSEATCQAWKDRIRRNQSTFCPPFSHELNNSC
jgi:phosphatidylserine/phosphatidylglycerophosphate/cardiolipin synthase-like enzyme